MRQKEYWNKMDKIRELADKELRENVRPDNYLKVRKELISRLEENLSRRLDFSEKEAIEVFLVEKMIWS